MGLAEARHESKQAERVWLVLLWPAEGEGARPTQIWEGFASRGHPVGQACLASVEQCVQKEEVHCQTQLAKHWCGRLWTLCCQTSEQVNTKTTNIPEA